MGKWWDITKYCDYNWLISWYIWGRVKIRVWIGPRWSRRMERSGSPAFWYGSGVWIGLWVQGVDRGFIFWLTAIYVYIYTYTFRESHPNFPRLGTQASCCTAIFPLFSLAWKQWEHWLQARYIVYTSKLTDWPWTFIMILMKCLLHSRSSFLK